MKYMLLIYVDEQALSESERQACYAESAQLAHEIKASGLSYDQVSLNCASQDTLHLQGVNVQELQHGGSRTQGSQLCAPAHQSL
jgi:hypothetical protein